MKSTVIRLGTIALMLAALSGCGGGSDGAAGPAGPAGATGPAGPAGTDAASGATVPSNATAATADAAAAWAALAPQVAITGVTIASPPVVKFTVTDAAGKPVVGLGNKSQSATATVAGLTNVAFTLAKLVPGTSGSPSKWVSYLVVRPPTVAEKTATPATSSCDAATNATWCGTYPTTDTQGTLVDNGDGSYVYTFYRDVKQAATIAASLTDSTDGLAKKADLGDLSFDATATHRLGIQIGGNAPGTGSNTPNAVTVTPSVPMVNTANIVYDFVPGGGAVSSTRNVVKIDSCSECHAGQVLAHGSRKDPQYCVTCHTDQIKYSFNKGESPLAADGITFVAPAATLSTAMKRANYAIVDGRAVGNYPNMIHKVHMGSRLVKQGYNYNNNGGAMMFNEVVFPQDVRNCTKCHDGSATAANKTANGDNWKGVPSALACGACHDGIDFKTGKGTALGALGKAAGGHVGGPQDDSKCYLCHDADSVGVYHRTENATPHNPSVPEGLSNFTYEIKSASATATAVTVVFKVSKDGTPVTFLPAAAGMANPLTGFTGSPGILLAYGKSQDGVTAPIDYNNLGNGSANAQPKSVSIANLLDTNRATTSGTLAGPDASGYYTATIVGSNVFPAGATLRTVALQSYFTQNGVGRHTLSTVKMVGTDTARRSVVDSNKCGNCHEWFEGHGGQRNIGLGSSGIVACVVCHNPGIVTSGRGISDAALGAYTFSAADNKILSLWGFNKTATNAALAFPQTSNNFKDMIHGLHAGKDRTNPIQIARDRTPNAINLIDGSEIGFPAILKKCETCHISGTYSGLPANVLATTYEADNGVFLNGTSRATADAKAALSQPNPGDKVTTPFAAACVSCHDSSAAKAHISLNGGQILALRSAMSYTNESCAVCHGKGSEFDPVKVHK